MQATRRSLLGSPNVARAYGCLGLRLGRLAVLLALPTAAGATTVVPMTTRDLTAVSVGGCARTRARSIGSAIDPCQRLRWWTYVTLAPEDWVPSATCRATATLVLREVGGQVGSRRQWVFGNPELSGRRARARLFLSPGHDGVPHTTALALGKFTLPVDRAGETYARCATLSDDIDRAGRATAPRHRRRASKRRSRRWPRCGRALQRRRRHSGALGCRFRAQPDCRRLRTRAAQRVVLLNPLLALVRARRLVIPFAYFVDTIGDVTLGPEGFARRSGRAALRAWRRRPRIAARRCSVAGDVEPGVRSPAVRTRQSDRLQRPVR